MLDFVRELDERDSALAAALAAAAAFEGRLDSVRERAAATAELLARLPGEMQRAAATERATQDELRAARDAAEAAQADASCDDAAAERRIESARAAASAAEGRAADATRAHEQLERQAVDADRERDRIDADVQALARELAALERMHDVAPPEAGLAGALDWSSRARAALFVLRGSLETERERVVRQASEVAAVVFGEPAYNVHVLRERLEAAAERAL